MRTEDDQEPDQGLLPDGGKLDGSSAVHGDRTQRPESGPRGPHHEGDVRTGDDQEEDQGLLPDGGPTTTVAVIDDRSLTPTVGPSRSIVAVPDADGSIPDSDLPTSKQLKHVADMCAELGEPVPDLATRREAISVVAHLRRRRAADRLFKKTAACETARLDGRAGGAGYASAGRCDGCGTLQYAEPGGGCPACGKPMRQRDVAP